MRPRVGPRSVVAGRSGGPCDDGCEVQRVKQLKQSCSKSIPRGAEPGGTGCSVSSYSKFMALMQEPRGHKGNVPRFLSWSERSLLRCARVKSTSAVHVSLLPLLADVHVPVRSCVGVFRVCYSQAEIVTGREMKRIASETVFRDKFSIYSICSHGECSCGHCLY